MRNFTLALLASLVCVLFVARCDSFIEAQPRGELNGETFYNTEEDFNAATIAAYSTLLNFYYDQSGNGWIQPIIYPSDDVRPSGSGNDLEEFNWQPTSGSFNTLWNESYKGILRTNTVLDRLPSAEDLDDPLKVRFEAEARFLRAYFHFILARNFGNAPIVDRVIQSVGEANVGNSEPGAIWTFIEEDLQFASENLPEAWDANNVGRATRFSAAALLGKVLLFDAQWRGDASKYEAAIAALEEVVNSERFQLMDNYRDNFRVETENNAESLFEVQMTRGDFNPWLPTDHPAGVGAAGSGRIIATGAGCYEGDCAPGANQYGYGLAHITETLQQEFESGDPRRFFTYYEEGDVYPSVDEDGNAPWDLSWSITGHTPAKYVRSDMDFSRFPLNFTTDNERVIRYADVLLMLAEAELLGNNNTPRAATMVNQVRERARANYEQAFGTSPPSDLLPDRPASASRGQMMEWIMHERRVELAVEGHRYDDLVRWHRAGLIDIASDIDFGSDGANQGWSETNLLKPIPQDELDNNLNLTQNPGY